MQTAETLLAIYGERGRHGRRKTLIVCERCHVAIHAGRPTRTHEDQEEPIKGYYPGTEEAHTNPTRQRGECLRALAGASG